MPTLPLPSFSFDVLEVMDDLIILTPPLAMDSRGESLPNTALAKTYRGKIEYEVREVRMNTGEERVSHANIYVSYVSSLLGVLTHESDLPVVTPEWFITFPDGSQPIILRVDKAYYADQSHLLIYT